MQVRSYIGKHLNPELVSAAERGELPPAPVGYHIPAAAAVVLAAGPNAAPASGVANSTDSSLPTVLPHTHQDASNPTPTTTSRFASLLSIAEGQVLVAPPSNPTEQQHVSATIPSLAQLAPWTSVPPPATLSLPNSVVSQPDKKRGPTTNGEQSNKKKKNSNRSARKESITTTNTTDSRPESTSLLFSSTEGVYDWGNSMWSSPQQLVPGVMSPTANSIFGTSTPFTTEALSDISKLGKDSLLEPLRDRHSNSNNEFVTFHVPDEFSMM